MSTISGSIGHGVTLAGSGSPDEEPRRWAFCAPRLAAAREVDAIRRRLLARARQLFPSPVRAA
jgi:hypothetical protein